MKLELRYFASVREALGTAGESTDAPAHVTTVGAVREWLAQRGDAWAEALAPSRTVRMARNHVMVKADEPVAEGDEVAFFPPVTGG